MLYQLQHLAGTANHEYICCKNLDGLNALGYEDLTALIGLVLLEP